MLRILLIITAVIKHIIYTRVCAVYKVKIILDFIEKCDIFDMRIHEKIVFYFLSKEIQTIRIELTS